MSTGVTRLLTVKQGSKGEEGVEGSKYIKELVEGEDQPTFSRLSHQIPPLLLTSTTFHHPVNY